VDLIWSIVSPFFVDSTATEALDKSFDHRALEAAIREIDVAADLSEDAWLKG
jgi:hypothetical protein